MLTAVHEGKLTLDRLVELMHTNPKRASDPTHSFLKQVYVFIFDY